MDASSHAENVLELLLLNYIEPDIDVANGVHLLWIEPCLLSLLQWECNNTLTVSCYGPLFVVLIHLESIGNI